MLALKARALSMLRGKCARIPTIARTSGKILKMHHWTSRSFKNLSNHFSWDGIKEKVGESGVNAPFRSKPLAGGERRVTGGNKRAREGKQLQRVILNNWEIQGWAWREGISQAVLNVLIVRDLNN